jgi:hypothetical protein
MLRGISLVYTSDVIEDRLACLADGLRDMVHIHTAPWVRSISRPGTTCAVLQRRSFGCTHKQDANSHVPQTRDK